MPRLLLLTPAELTRDPRARRAAAAGVDAGWDVIGACPAVGGVPARLDGVTVIRVGGERLDSTLRGFGLGGGRRDRAIVRELRGLYRLVRLARMTASLSRALRHLEGVDVVHANDLDTLPVGQLLARRHRARLVYDAHELYTSQELDPPRFQRIVMRRLEGVLARRAAAVITVSSPIADELERRLRLPATPLVVANYPPLTATAAPESASLPLRAVYQGAVGVGRSLADLLDSAAQVEDVVVSVRLVGVDATSVRAAVAARGLDDRLVVLDAVDPDALVESLTEFDVGLIITRPLTLNDRLAAPNKLFEYLMAGLAVVAPDVAGVSAVVEAEQVGVTYEAGSPTALARQLTSLAGRLDEVTLMKRRARHVARERFNAEAQRAVLHEAWTGQRLN